MLTTACQIRAFQMFWQKPVVKNTFYTEEHMYTHV